MDTGAPDRGWLRRGWPHGRSNRSIARADRGSRPGRRPRRHRARRFRRGGVAGLAILNFYQPQQLDMLTLLGFVILIGIVVNNAILLVHQARYHLIADGMNVNDAIREATRNRIRPIFMSTLTSVFGMLPLVVFPGAGSELYRGLGVVVVGGLSMSAFLTLLTVPPLLRRSAATLPSTIATVAATARSHTHPGGPVWPSSPDSSGAGSGASVGSVSAGSLSVGSIIKVPGTGKDMVGA